MRRYGDLGRSVFMARGPREDGVKIRLLIQSSSWDPKTCKPWKESGTSEGVT